jgi:hypothetical protein
VVKRRPTLPVFVAASALFLVPWYLSEHWGIAWAGFDIVPAAALALTGVAGLRRAPWLDRPVVAGARRHLPRRGGRRLRHDRSIAVELPVALLCIWVARRFATPAARERNTLATTHEQGVLQ